jgi:uncharacterized protein (TIGR03083 family)
VSAGNVTVPPTALAALVPLNTVGKRVDAALTRFCELMRTAPDGAVPVPGLSWTVGELGAHMVTGARLWSRMLAGEPSPITSLRDGAAATALMIADLEEREPARLADLIELESRATAAALGNRDPDELFPWHAGLQLTMGQAEAVGLGELLVHGFDLARAVGRPWPIEPADARAVIYAAGAILPALVDPVRAQGVTASYELRLRGGSSLALRIRDGALVVEPGPDPRAVCRISADPTAFLLISYGRVSPWRYVTSGRILAWGRRPWAMARLATMLQGF